MSAICRIICLSMVIFLLAIFGTGCVRDIDAADDSDNSVAFDPFYPAEKTAADKVMDAVCGALNTGNPDMIVNLFSDNVRMGDEKLRENAGGVIKAFGGGTAVCWDIGVSHSGQTITDGETIAYIEMLFVINDGDDYYWCRMHYVYENDGDVNDVGLKWLKFYTIDEYYLLLSEEGEDTAADGSGIFVYADYKVGMPLRCICSIPYIYDETGCIDAPEASAFLKENNSFEDFKIKFGKPNSDSMPYAVYGLENGDGEDLYLELFVEGENGTISSAGIVSDAAWVERIQLYGEKE